jgi:MarR family 2-MHQ and catechol resistance regulon transcriptional repressor
MRSNDLAAELFLDKSTTSRVVGALERKGYVARADDPHDKRAIRLTVTPAGRGLHKRIERDLIAEEEVLLQDFEPEVRAAASKLLFRLARAVEARSGRSRPGCCVTGKE